MTAATVRVRTGGISAAVEINHADVPEERHGAQRCDRPEHPGTGQLPAVRRHAAPQRPHRVAGGGIGRLAHAHHPTRWMVAAAAGVSPSWPDSGWAVVSVAGGCSMRTIWWATSIRAGR